MSIVSKFV